MTIGVSLLLLVLRVLRAGRGSPATLVDARDRSRRRCSRFSVDIGPLRVHRRLLRRRRRHRRHAASALGAFFRSPTWASPCGRRPRTASGRRCSASRSSGCRRSCGSLAAVLSAVAVFLRAPLVGLTLAGSIGPSVLLFGLAAAVIARMESLPMACSPACASASSTRPRCSAPAAPASPTRVDARRHPRRPAGAAGSHSPGPWTPASSTWQAVKEYRPIPAELRDAAARSSWPRASLAERRAVRRRRLPAASLDRDVRRALHRSSSSTPWSACRS